MPQRANLPPEQEGAADPVPSWWQTPMWERPLSGLRVGAKQGVVEIHDDGPNAEGYEKEEPYQESESWGKNPA
eukprot:8507389-Alexandrium_andersonii.AAC.1